MLKVNFMSNENLTTYQPKEYFDRDIVPSPESIPADILEMYQVPGHEEITAKVMERYLQSKKQDPKLLELVEAEKEEQRKNPPFAERFKQANKDEWPQLIREALDSSEIEDKFEAVRKISELPRPGEKALWLKRALNSNDIQVQSAATHEIEKAKLSHNPIFKDKIIEAIKTGLASNDPETQITATLMIWHVPKEAKAELIEMVLDNGNIIAQTSIVPHIVGEADDKQRYKLWVKAEKIVRTTLDSEDINSQRIAAKVIGVFQEERPGGLDDQVVKIIRDAFASGNIQNMKTAARMIDNAPSGYEKLLFEEVKQALGDKLVESPLYNKTNFSG